MRMRIQIRLFNLMRIRIKSLKKCSAHIPYISACHLQIDADPEAVLDPAYHFDADPDPDFYLMRIRIVEAFADPGYKMMRIYTNIHFTCGTYCSCL